VNDQMRDGTELGASELLDLPLRVSAEVGRAKMPAADVVAMPEGTIVPLDREPDDAADLYVNGRHYGTGRVMLVDGEWAVKIESLDAEIEQASSDGSEPQAAAD
jgi:flagellar motor switch protein FliN/FliY